MWGEDGAWQKKQHGEQNIFSRKIRAEPSRTGADRTEPEKHDVALLYKDIPICINRQTRLETEEGGNEKSQIVKTRARPDLRIVTCTNKLTKHRSLRTSLKQDRTSVVFSKDLQNPLLRGSLIVEAPGCLQSTPYSIQRDHDSGPWCKIKKIEKRLFMEIRNRASRC